MRLLKAFLYSCVRTLGRILVGKLFRLAVLFVGISTAAGQDLTIDLDQHKTLTTCASRTGGESGQAVIDVIVQPGFTAGTYTLQRYVGASAVNGTVQIVVASNGTYTRNPSNGTFPNGELDTNALPRTWTTKITAAPAGSGYSAGDVLTGSTILYQRLVICDGSTATTATYTHQTLLLGTSTRTLGITGEIEADYCMETHTVTVEVNGSVVATGTTAGGGGASQSAVASYSDDSNHEGQSYAIKVDGVAIKSGTITYTCGEFGCTFFAAEFGHPLCSATPTPTPTATPTPTPTPTSRKRP